MEGWTEGTVEKGGGNHKRRPGSAPPEAAPIHLMEGGTEGNVEKDNNSPKRRLGSAPPEAAPVAYTPLSALWKAGQREPLRKTRTITNGD